MGADEAVHVKLSDEDYATLQPLAVAKILSEVTKQQKADLVIVGKQVSHASFNNYIDHAHIVPSGN